MSATTIEGTAIKAGTLTDAQVASANKDGASGTACMRTTGTGAGQAAAGTHASQHQSGGADAISAGHLGRTDRHNDAERLHVSARPLPESAE